MATSFRLREVLERAKPPISQSDIARESGLAFATINRICTNATEQVALETLDKILGALSRRGVNAGIEDLIAWEPRRSRSK